MAISTQLIVLIKNIYSLWGLPRLHLPVTYFFLRNLIYPQGINKEGENLTFNSSIKNELNTNLEKIFRLDYRGLKEIIINDKLPIPNMDEILGK